MAWNFIEYNIEDLYVFLQSYSETEDIEYQYALVLYHYLLANTEELRRHVFSLNKTNSIVKEISQVRLHLKENNLEKLKTSVEALNERVLLENNKVLQAEAFFVLGIAFDKQKNYLDAELFFKKSSNIFKESNLLQKSLKAYHNQVTLLSHIHPSPSHIIAYQDLHDQALNLKNIEIQKMALYNISVHFFKIKAFNNSLNYIEKTIKLYNKIDLGRDYYLALLQLCKVKFELNQLDSVRSEFEMCLVSEHKDIKTAAELILAKDIQNIYAKENLPNSWNNCNLHNEELTDSESKLISILTEKPSSKEEIVKELFGEKIEYTSGLNRFNNLLSRVRKKINFKIQLYNSKYTLIFSKNDWTSYDQL